VRRICGAHLVVKLTTKWFSYAKEQTIKLPAHTLLMLPITTCPLKFEVGLSGSRPSKTILLTNRNAPSTEPFLLKSDL
jgi:hypothetical protein